MNGAHTFGCISDSLNLESAQLIKFMFQEGSYQK